MSINKDNLSKLDSIEKLFSKIKGIVSYGTMDDVEEEKILSNLESIKESAERIEQTTLLSNLEAAYNFNKRYINDIKPKGINKYVNITDIKNLIRSVKSYISLKPLVLTTMQEFPRPIPDKNVKEIEKVKDLFDEIYILYTDYTGQDREVSDEIKKEKDPIAFGIMKHEFENGKVIYSEKMFFITDWVDEYCDLTLEKLIEEYDIDLYTDDDIDGEIHSGVISEDTLKGYNNG